MVNEFEGVWILATFGFVQQSVKIIRVLVLKPKFCAFYKVRKIYNFACLLNKGKIVNLAKR